MSAPLRVAMVDPSLFTPPYDMKLVGALRERGHDVTLYGRPLVPSDQPIARPYEPLFYRELARIGAHRWPKPAARAAKGVVHVLGMARLIARLKRLRPDIIHFQWLPLPAVDRLYLSRLRRIAPIVLTAHDSRPFNSNPAARVQAMGAISALGRFDLVVVHTEQAKARLVEYGVDPARIARIAHGLLLEEEAPAPPLPAAAPDARLTFLLFGKLKPYKGADLLLAAFARLTPAQRARAQVVIAGEPHMPTGEIEAAAAALGPGARVDLRYLSEDEVRAELVAADVVVFPYREIEVSGVLMAALRLGKPVIATRIGGFAEILRDGPDGMLVPPDDVAALAASVSRAIDDAGYRAALAGASAAALDAVPGWDAIAGETEAAYRGAIARRAA
jgi:glycosyltransferase involved in cell wall biosynthesis